MVFLFNLLSTICKNRELCRSPVGRSFATSTSVSSTSSASSTSPSSLLLAGFSSCELCPFLTRWGASCSCFSCCFLYADSLLCYVFILVWFFDCTQWKKGGERKKRRERERVWLWKNVATKHLRRHRFTIFVQLCLKIKMMIVVVAPQRAKWKRERERERQKKEEKRKSKAKERKQNLVSFIMHFHFWLPSAGTCPKTQTNAWNGHTVQSPKWDSSKWDRVEGK